MENDRFDSGVTRRSAVKTAGAVGLFSLAGFTGTAAAKNEEKSYGNGNGIGSFLNEAAEYKETPIWTGEVADMRGEPIVTIENGAMTSVELPGFPPELPVAFDPLVVQVSPGATVRWEWIASTPPIPHNVVSLDETEDGSPLFENPETGVDGNGDPTNVVYDPGLSYEYTFEDRGNYLYYCTPHGAPFPVTNFQGNEVYNEFGMRGAVKVTGKPL